MKTALVRTILALVAATTMATVVGSNSASAAPAAPAAKPSAAFADAPVSPASWTPIASFATRRDCEAARSQVPYPSFCVGAITGGYVLWADI